MSKDQFSIITEVYDKLADVYYHLADVYYSDRSAITRAIGSVYIALDEVDADNVEVIADVIGNLNEIQAEINRGY